MGQADSPIVFVVMPGEEREWRSIEMTPAFRRLVTTVIVIAMAVTAVLSGRGLPEHRKTFALRTYQAGTS